MFKSVVCLLALTMSSVAFCHNAIGNHDEVLEAILATENEGDYVSHCDEGKVYLRGEKLFVTEQEIYVCLEDVGFLPVRP